MKPRHIYWFIYPVLLVAALVLGAAVSVLAAPFIALLVTSDLVLRPEKFGLDTEPAVLDPQPQPRFTA